MRCFLFLIFIFATVAEATFIYTYVTPVAVTATTTSTKVMNANSLRKYLLIVNTGANTVYVKFGTVQSGIEGIPIPSGGNYEPHFAPGNSVWIETAASTSAVVIQEGN